MSYKDDLGSAISFSNYPTLIHRYDGEEVNLGGKGDIIEEAVANQIPAVLGGLEGLQEVFVMVEVKGFGGEGQVAKGIFLTCVFEKVDEHPGSQGIFEGELTLGTGTNNGDIVMDLGNLATHLSHVEETGDNNILGSG